MNRTFFLCLFALSLAAAACGSDSADSSSATTAMEAMEDGDAMEGMEDGDAMEGMEDGAMNMGDVNATRADEISGAELESGPFELLDTRSPGHDGLAGTAWLARFSQGTTATVELSGLKPDTKYISHVHADVCENNGGDHYQFEVGGSVTPPNEIHLAFTSDTDGNGFMTAENAMVAGDDAVALVVHELDLLDNKIACVDFVAS